MQLDARNFVNKLLSRATSKLGNSIRYNKQMLTMFDYKYISAYLMIEFELVKHIPNTYAQRSQMLRRRG